MIAPAVWRQFPWGKGVKPGEDLVENKLFLVFARQFVGMLDMAIDMLGPDLEMVEGQLQLLGIRHISYGVMPKHYPLMGKALLQTMENKLGDSFTDRLHDSWNAIYTFMSVSMMQGAFQELMKVRKEHEVLKAEELVREKRRERIQARKDKKRLEDQTSRGRRNEVGFRPEAPSSSSPRHPRGLKDSVEFSEGTYSSTEGPISSLGGDEDSAEENEVASVLVAKNKGPLRTFAASSLFRKKRFA